MPEKKLRCGEKVQGPSGQPQGQRGTQWAQGSWVSPYVQELVLTLPCGPELPCTVLEALLRAALNLLDLPLEKHDSLASTSPGPALLWPGVQVQWVNVASRGRTGLMGGTPSPMTCRSPAPHWLP